MKLYNILLVLIIAGNICSCSSRETTNKEGLLEAIEKFNKAFQAGDVDIIASLITDNYIHTNGNSKSIRKEDWFTYLNNREKEIKSGTLEVIEYEMNEIEIEHYENMAIVTGKVLVSNKIKGEISINEYRITNLWVHVNGGWKRAGFHDGKIK